MSPKKPQQSKCLRRLTFEENRVIGEAAREQAKPVQPATESKTPHLLVSEYADYLPLYLQGQTYVRGGIDLDLSTTADWVGRSTALMEPLALENGRIVHRVGGLFTDDTPLKMRALEHKKIKTAQVWTYAHNEQKWSGSPCNVHGISLLLIA